MDLRKNITYACWSSLILVSTLACTIAHSAPLSSVAIWSYMGEPISVHCHDQFTDLVQRRMPHASDYVFMFYQNPDNTTLYTCSFMWGLNRTQEFPVWEAPIVDPVKRCGDGMFKCLYKVTKEGFYMASLVASGNVGRLANWLFVSPWAEAESEGPDLVLW